MEIINHHICSIILVLAFFLDLLMGDPPPLPHPVRIIGKGITLLERCLRRPFSTPGQEKTAGMLLAVLVVLSVFLAAYLVEKWVLFSLKGLARLAGILFLVYLAASTIAAKELLKAGLRVIEAVKEGDMGRARIHLGMIVGRDVHGLEKKAILKAAMETLSENLSDGVIAPFFYFILGGLPLAMAYKAINTLDSMVGYRNEKYMNLGWASARLDDIANYIPARISGLLIALSSFLLYKSRMVCADSLRTMVRDGKRHPSPNSGYPEAALAGALGVSLGGPSTYNGILMEKPCIGQEKTADYLPPSFDAIRLVRLSSFTGFFLSLIILFLWELP
ncbi:adenosylcobinamide-phosphate synthase CbiB [Syntrophorhabdus aromaticivorans]|uniref:Cobalamin biosynthesis protein CobD n=1 Tax=Syntrophorhabdus aromaticivorans TaxID=328301 RepID=A0A971M631_9BACT|nr:adenosylcobinamide-phosphate synthase CbiB [Syntrophorhabdus aromaticivorans]NLW36510.1 cobalamin biosynthesis protein CobD [Syntrophorhabdus aromaticivorans]